MVDLGEVQELRSLVATDSLDFGDFGMGAKGVRSNLAFLNGGQSSNVATEDEMADEADEGSCGCWLCFKLYDTVARGDMDDEDEGIALKSRHPVTSDSGDDGGCEDFLDSNPESRELLERHDFRSEERNTGGAIAGCDPRSAAAKAAAVAGDDMAAATLSRFEQIKKRRDPEMGINKFWEKTKQQRFTIFPRQIKKVSREKSTF